MCFQFGAVLGIDALEGSWTFLAVVAFLLTFEFFVGLLEYLVEGSTVYNQMVQKIYKELMIMGLVSFTIVMYEATVQDHSDAVVKVITAIDFNHLLLFFVAIFFVVHAIVLIKVSAGSAKEFFFMFNKPVSEVISNLDSVFANPISRFFFNMQYLPFSSERELVEFKLVHRLFTDTYSMSHDFNFSFYLTGCFEEYALKAMEGGVLPWFALVFLVVLNYIRIAFSLGYSCPSYHEDDHRRLEGGVAPLTDCQVDVFLWYVSGCAVLLCVYLIVLMLVARLYQLRMIQKVGVQHPGDYIEFLSYTDGERKRVLAECRAENTNPHTGIPRPILKETIQALLDEEEHDEETETYRLIVLHVSGAYAFVMVHWLELVGKIRTFFGTAIHTAGDAVMNGKLSFDARESAEDAEDEQHTSAVGSPKILSGLNLSKEGGHEGGHGTDKNLRQSLRTVRLASSRTLSPSSGTPVQSTSSRKSVLDQNGHGHGHGQIADQTSVFDKSNASGHGEAHAHAHAPSLADAVKDWRRDHDHPDASFRGGSSTSSIPTEKPSPVETEVAAVKSPGLNAFKEDEDDKSSCSSDSGGEEFVPIIVHKADNAKASKRRASIATLQLVGSEIAAHGAPGELTMHFSRLSSTVSDELHAQNMTLMEKYKLKKQKELGHEGRKPKSIWNCFGLCYQKGKVKSIEHASESSAVRPFNGPDDDVTDSPNHISAPSEVMTAESKQKEHKTPMLLVPFVFIGEYLIDIWDSIFCIGKYAIMDENDFSSIFLLNRPQLFFGAVNIGIMFNCFYMGMWITNFHTIVHEYIGTRATLYQILL